jgi:serine/threonine protein kinase
MQARIRKLLHRDWDPGHQGNITDEFIIVSPFLPGTLCAVIPSLNVSQLVRATFFGKILSAVEFLHANGFIHRDIKPENILVESFDPPVPKISDWGCVSSENRILYDGSGTISYLAPEQGKGEYHGSPVDAWACGLIGYELLFSKRTGTRVLPGPRLISMSATLRTFKCDVALMPFCCRRLLEADPEERFSAKEALDVFLLRGEDTIRSALDNQDLVDTEDTAMSSSKRMKLRH